MLNSINAANLGELNILQMCELHPETMQLNEEVELDVALGNKMIIEHP